jgi:hypothetical protein
MLDIALNELRDSSKFHNWKREERVKMPANPIDFSSVERSNLLKCNMMAEKHYTPAELAELWGVSVQTIREVFKDEEGVLKLGSNGTRTRRAYKTLRIPESVAERVHYSKWIHERQAAVEKAVRSTWTA